MPRDNISDNIDKKLKKYYTLTLDKNADGVINWEDFADSIEKIVPIESVKKSGRLAVVRKRLEQNYKQYFWDLCEVGDANKDGKIDLDEWLDVMNDIILHLKENHKFPEWYEGLHKAMWRSYEFLDDRNVLREEFVDMLSIWDLPGDKIGAAFDFVTEDGQKHMNYDMFSEFMKSFFINNDPSCPINMGLMD